MLVSRSLSGQCFPKIAAIMRTVIHNATAYTPYHNVSCAALMRGGLKTTSDPVELACMNCGSRMLFVFVWAPLLCSPPVFIRT
jgi:DNA-directed RNA polymerase subunit RPC12/RpoP